MVRVAECVCRVSRLSGTRNRSVGYTGLFSKRDGSAYGTEGLSYCVTWARKRIHSPLSPRLESSWPRAKTWPCREIRLPCLRTRLRSLAGENRTTVELQNLLNMLRLSYLCAAAASRSAIRRRKHPRLVYTQVDAIYAIARRKLDDAESALDISQQAAYMRSPI
jgi:hypothetical protein